MVRETVEQTVQCTPDQFLALVMDPRRYAQIDDKLGPIDWVRREGNVTRFRFRSHLPGVPGPSPKVVSQMTLTPGERVDIEYAPVPENRINHRMSTFAASFVCAPAAHGTRVSRTIELGFAPLLRWILEPVLRRTLRPDLQRELAGAKSLAEKGLAGSSASPAALSIGTVHPQPQPHPTRRSAFRNPRIRPDHVILKIINTANHLEMIRIIN